MPRPAALSLSAIDGEAPEEEAPLLLFVILDIALARAYAAADNTHSAYMSFDFACGVMYWSITSWDGEWYCPLYIDVYLCVHVLQRIRLREPMWQSCGFV